MMLSILAIHISMNIANKFTKVKDIYVDVRSL